MSQFEASNDNPRPPHRERRGAPRRRVLFGGKIISLHDNLSADCTIRNLSPCGARISATLANNIQVGAALIVIRRAMLHEYKLAWLWNAQAGLSFLSCTDLSRSDVLPANFVPARRLWLEMMPR